MSNPVFYKVLFSRDPQEFELFVSKWLQDGFKLFGEPHCIKTDSGVTLLVQVVINSSDG